MAQVKRIELFRFLPQTTHDVYAEVFEAFDEMVGAVSGLVELAAGPYDSPEGANKGFTHAVVMTFADADARDAWLLDAKRHSLDTLIREHLVGGDAGRVAFDFACSDRFRYTWG